MSEKFTPGEWHQELRPCGIGCCDDMCDIFAQYPGEDSSKRHIATVNGGNAVWLKECEAEGNRHLIAAAPDLYAACKAALEDGPHNASHGLSSRVVKQLQAALNKALGE